MVNNDPSRAVSMLWAAINAGDRVDSALKDMEVVMKQLNRSDEAIEAIKSFCHLCPYDSQVSLDNVLIELYKRSGKIAEAIEILQCKLNKIEECIAFGYDERSLKCVSSGPAATSQFSPLSVFDISLLKTKVDGLVLLVR
ncbi:hypothetical protein Pint_19583 [Pistacia integerrima]|uniref:Uncharacterized protein n=1 Tax=Pistacia integerrima TaxID=434235 RepID=A0ACC0XEM1_9ROSI|nr:hypothetical protein Pint_19583 [Pistacia integerrima]